MYFAIGKLSNANVYLPIDHSVVGAQQLTEQPPYRHTNTIKSFSCSLRRDLNNCNDLRLCEPRTAVAMCLSGPDPGRLFAHMTRLSNLPHTKTTTILSHPHWFPVTFNTHCQCISCTRAPVERGGLAERNRNRRRMNKKKIIPSSSTQPHSHIVCVGMPLMPIALWLCMHGSHFNTMVLGSMLIPPRWGIVGPTSVSARK